MSAHAIKPRPPCFTEGGWRTIPVPHEAQAALNRYTELLLFWGQNHNLIAPSTVAGLWTRHMMDSAQLLPLLPANTHCLVDLGSGAGFPGLVLSILGVPEVHLIESTGKKARFLEEVAKELGLNVIVHNERIEKVRGLKADVVTARALTSLKDLLGLAQPFMDKKSRALFLKGEKADAELTEAAKYWTFAYDKIPSLSDASGVVLRLSAVKAQRPHDPRKQHKRTSKQ